MIRLTIGNQRGGVGKTTTAVTIARLWAERGLRTLLVDADPQGSIGSILRVKPELYLNDFLWNKRRLADCVIQPVENLDVLCSNRDTLEAEQRATGTIGRERIFENIFQPIEDNYDAVLIDIGPSLSLMQICAMVYTTEYVIPISMDALSVTGATAFFNTAQQLEVQIRKSCRCVGLLPTIVDHRYQNTEMVMKMIHLTSEHYKVPVLPGHPHRFGGGEGDPAAAVHRGRRSQGEVPGGLPPGLGSAPVGLRNPGGEGYECRRRERVAARRLRKIWRRRSRRSSTARSRAPT